MQEIFKVSIYTKELSFELEEFCNDFKINNEGRIKSNEGGYQSNDIPYLMLLPNFTKELEHHATVYANQFINNNKQIMDNMWININQYRDSNAIHNHPNADISGVYYVKTPIDCGKLVFENPAKTSLNYYTYGQNITNFNSLNSSDWAITPTKNTLYLFPSWLNHLVLPNENKEEDRISISFNTYNFEGK